MDIQPLRGNSVIGKGIVLKTKDHFLLSGKFAAVAPKQSFSFILPVFFAEAASDHRSAFDRLAIKSNFGAVIVSGDVENE